MISRLHTSYNIIVNIDHFLEYGTFIHPCGRIEPAIGTGKECVSPGLISYFIDSNSYLRSLLSSFPLPKQM